MANYGNMPGKPQSPQTWGHETLKTLAKPAREGAEDEISQTKTEFV
jgi:hypothetical protein